MAQVKKNCKPAECKEELVDNVPTGPRDCLPMKDCPAE